MAELSIEKCIHTDFHWLSIDFFFISRQTSRSYIPPFAPPVNPLPPHPFVYVPWLILRVEMVSIFSLLLVFWLCSPPFRFNWITHDRVKCDMPKSHQSSWDRQHRYLRPYSCISFFFRQSDEYSTTNFPWYIYLIVLWPNWITTWTTWKPTLWHSPICSRLLHLAWIWTFTVTEVQS
jgi:hypothetical protein